MRRALLTLAATVAALFTVTTGTASAGESGTGGVLNECSNWGIRTATHIVKTNTDIDYGAIQLLRRTCPEGGKHYYEYLARGFAYFEPTMPANLRLVAGIPGTDRWCYAHPGQASMCTTYPPYRGGCHRASGAIQQYNATTRTWTQIAYGTTPTVC
jgi:hypothetical protein